MFNVELFEKYFEVPNDLPQPDHVVGAMFWNQYGEYPWCRERILPAQEWKSWTYPGSKGVDRFDSTYDYPPLFSLYCSEAVCMVDVRFSTPKVESYLNFIVDNSLLLTKLKDTKTENQHIFAGAACPDRYDYRTDLMIVGQVGLSLVMLVFHEKLALQDELVAKWCGSGLFTVVESSEEFFDTWQGNKRQRDKDRRGFDYMRYGPRQDWVLF